MEDKLIPMPISIQPSDIDTSRHFREAFGNSETETSAIWIVNFCKDRGDSWSNFTHGELEAFYNNKGRLKSFWYNKLFDLGCLHHITQHDETGRMSTEDELAIDFRFVARCYVASLGCSFSGVQSIQQRYKPAG